MSKNFDEVVFAAVHPSAGGQASFSLANSAWAKLVTLAVTITLDSGVVAHRGFTWSVLDSSGNTVYTQPLEASANWTPSSNPPPQPIMISDQEGAGGFGGQFQSVPDVWMPPNSKIVFNETANIDTSDTIALVGVIEF